MNTLDYNTLKETLDATNQQYLVINHPVTNKAIKIKISTFFDMFSDNLVIAASDENTALTTGTKVTFRMPYAMKLSGVRASLTTAQTSGNTFTVDINQSGNSILSTKLTIDNTEKTSKTASIPSVLSNKLLTDDSEITIDIDQIGDGTATGLKITLLGRKI